MGNLYKTILEELTNQPTLPVSPDLKQVTSPQTAVILPTVSWPGTLGNIAYTADFL